MVPRLLSPAELSQKAVEIYRETRCHQSVLKFLNQYLAHYKADSFIRHIYFERSKVYEQMNLWEAALKNLILAENCGYAGDIAIRKLFCEACLSLGPEEDNLPFFTLTYQSHPRIPYIIEDLMCINNTQYGNHVITTRNLNIGDVISIENPLFTVTTNNMDVPYNIEVSQCYQRCAHCHKSNNMNLLPCHECSKAMYCSDTCRNISWDIYHRFECHISRYIDNIPHLIRGLRTFFLALYLNNGNILKMRHDFEHRDIKPTTVFDFDLSDHLSSDYFPNLMSTFETYRTSNKCDINPVYQQLFLCHPYLLELWNEHSSFILMYIACHADNLRELGQIVLKWPTNGQQIMKTKSLITSPSEFRNELQIVGVDYFPFTGLITHSCMPNVARHINEYNQMVLIVIRPIRRGEQLFDDHM